MKHIGPLSSVRLSEFRTQFECPARKRLVARVPKGSVLQSLSLRKAIPLGSRR